MSHKTPQQLARMDKTDLIAFAVEIQREKILMQAEWDRDKKRGREAIRLALRERKK